MNLVTWGPGPFKKNDRVSAVTPHRKLPVVLDGGGDCSLRYGREEPLSIVLCWSPLSSSVGFSVQVGGSSEVHSNVDALHPELIIFPRGSANLVPHQRTPSSRFMPASARYPRYGLRIACRGFHGALCRSAKKSTPEDGPEPSCRVSTRDSLSAWYTTVMS